MRYKIFVATATHVHLASARRSQARPRNGDLDFFEELDMTALLYRGHTYGANPTTQPRSALSSPIATSTTTLAVKMSLRTYIQCCITGVLPTPSKQSLIIFGAPPRWGFFMAEINFPAEENRYPDGLRLTK
jgi:hypothetical protein